MKEENSNSRREMLSMWLVGGSFVDFSWPPYLEFQLPK